MAKDWKKGSPIDERLQQKLRELIRHEGKNQVAERFGIGATTLVHAAAGIGVRRATATVIEIRLTEMNFR
jgi:hypothetical protein